MKIGPILAAIFSCLEIKYHKCHSLIQNEFNVKEKKRSFCLKIVHNCDWSFLTYTVYNGYNFVRNGKKVLPDMGLSSLCLVYFSVPVITWHFLLYLQLNF